MTREKRVILEQLEWARQKMRSTREDFQRAQSVALTLLPKMRRASSEYWRLYELVHTPAKRQAARKATR